MPSCLITPNDITKIPKETNNKRSSSHPNIELTKLDE